MDALAALLTTDFHDSNWTDQEVGFAIGRGEGRSSDSFGAAKADVPMSVMDCA